MRISSSADPYLGNCGPLRPGACPIPLELSRLWRQQCLEIDDDRIGAGHGNPWRQAVQPVRRKSPPNHALHDRCPGQPRPRHGPGLGGHAGQRECDDPAHRFSIPASPRTSDTPGRSLLAGFGGSLRAGDISSPGASGLSAGETVNGPQASMLMSRLCPVAEQFQLLTHLGREQLLCFGIQLGAPALDRERPRTDQARCKASPAGNCPAYRPASRPSAARGPKTLLCSPDPASPTTYSAWAKSAILRRSAAGSLARRGQTLSDAGRRPPGHAASLRR